MSAVLCGLLFVRCLASGRRVPDALTFQVEKGMTRDEVYATLGEPNERQWHAGEELWGYYIQEFGWSAWVNPVYVSFGADGRVTARWCQ